MKIAAAFAVAALVLTPAVAEPDWAPLIDTERADLDFLRSALDSFPVDRPLSPDEADYARAFAGNIWRRCAYRQALPLWRAYADTQRLTTLAMGACSRDYAMLTMWAKKAGQADPWLKQFAAETAGLVSLLIDECRNLRDRKEIADPSDALSAQDGETLRLCNGWASGKIR